MNADHKLLGTDLDKIAPAADAGRPSSNDYRRAARRLHERDGVIEIEEFAHIEDADDRPGVWVEAWVWVSDEDVRAEDTPAQGEN